jgi:carbon-monoxide dehydrogenase medium subunit
VCHVELDQGKIAKSRVVYFSVASTPVLTEGVQALLQSKTLQELSQATLIEQAKDIARSEIMTLSDLTSSAQMKTHLVGVLLERALQHIAS